ncbi:MAG: CDP-alcohol phosphatidyltransferase family protein [Acidobacteriota bacterium]
MTMCSAHHVRDHRSVLMAMEKRLLIWIARRLPGRVTSDHLTLLGLLAMLLAGVAYWAARWDERALLLVAVALAFNWLGDSLDGTLARVRNCPRPRYGFYVDHIIDMMGACFLLGGLAASGYMTPLIACGLLCAFLLVSAESFLATHVLGVFRLAFLQVGPTELRILLAVGTLWVIHEPTVQLGNWGPFLLFDVGGACGIAGLAVALTVSAIRNTRMLYRAEPLARNEA